MQTATMDLIFSLKLINSDIEEVPATMALEKQEYCVLMPWETRANA